MIKWVEAVALGGGLAALLIPFIGCYVAWIQIRRQKEFKKCYSTMDKDADQNDYTRFVMGINQILMYLFLALYSVAFTKSRRTKRQIRFVGVMIPIILVVTVVMAIVNWGLYASSHCKDQTTYGTAAIISNNVMFVLTLITTVASGVIFFLMSNRGASGGRVGHSEERTSLVPENSNS